MPRAKDNRKPVGTETCSKCGFEADFLQVQKGRFTGYLYRKGCECKADQRTLPYLQLEWLERMKRTPHPMMPHPLTVQGAPATPEPKPQKPAPEPVQTPEPEAAEPLATTEGNQKTEGKARGFIGLALLVGSVAVAMMN